MKTPWKNAAKKGQHPNIVCADQKHPFDLARTPEENQKFAEYMIKAVNNHENLVRLLARFVILCPAQRDQDISASASDRIFAQGHIKLEDETLKLLNSLGKFN